MIEEEEERWNRKKKSKDSRPAEQEAHNCPNKNSELTADRMRTPNGGAFIDIDGKFRAIVRRSIIDR
jgi:ribosomal protein S1